MLGYNRADEGEWDPEAYKNRSLANSQTESNQSVSSKMAVTAFGFGFD